jgi:hypothetical protein
MLLLAGGLVVYKVSRGGQEPEVIEELVKAPAAVAAPAQVLDEAPPPPPSEEEVAAEPKAAEVDPKSVKIPAGPSGCSGPCTGSAGSDLQAALASRGASARSCYNTALRRNSNLEGKMTVNVRVNPSGTVCSVGISNNTLGDASLAGCVSGQFRSTKFPAPKGSCVDTAVPLNFTAKK